MKIFINLLSLVLLMATSLSTNAQTVNENDASMSAGMKNAMIVEIEGAKKKVAEKIWKDFVKNYGKAKKEGDEYVSKMALIPAISSQTVNIHFKMEEMSDMTRAYLWIDNGEYFINSVEHEQQAEGMEDLLKKYYGEVRKKVIEEEVKEEEKKLKNQEKDLKGLVKKNDGYHKDIEKAKKKIAEMEANIEQNLQEQEAAKMELEKQTELLKSVREKINSIGKM